MRHIALKSFAKINLGLAVIGRRADGYHELRTIYQSISLADDIEVSLSSRAETVRLETSGFAVPAGQENLAVRAALAMRKELRIRSGIRIALKKRIPPGSGLGGASSDAAAVLRAVLFLSRKSLPTERLLHLAAELGSDVPFFFIGGRAVGVGRGEEVYPLPEPPRCAVVILFPGEGMSTAEAYRLLRRPRLTAVGVRPNIELFCGHAIDGGAPHLANDFEPMLFERLPQLARAKRNLLQLGAVSASLTGSGSALFGLFQHRAKAQRAAHALRNSGAMATIFLARTITRREYSQRARFLPHSV
jgi:4-diphosphocytidyl-2-C-methyl-D-erythritol kinase